jgi:hypothetical protein
MMKGATEHGHASTFVKFAQDSIDYYQIANQDTSEPIISQVIQEFSVAGYNVQMLPVEYEFQRGGDRMLKISK